MSYLFTELQGIKSELTDNNAIFDRNNVHFQVNNIKFKRSYDMQRMKRALMGRFSHFQFLNCFNRYMSKLLICVLFVRKLYTSVQ